MCVQQLGFRETFVATSYGVGLKVTQICGLNGKLANSKFQSLRLRFPAYWLHQHHPQLQDWLVISQPSYPQQRLIVSGPNASRMGRWSRSAGCKIYKMIHLSAVK